MSNPLSELDLTPNRIELARRSKAGQYVDLTSSNPTENGWLFPHDILRTAAEPYWHSRRYDPNPRGAIVARTAIAQYYAQRRCEINPDHIFITASTSEAYSLLLSLLTQPNDAVLSPEITYPLFEHLAALHHIELKTYRHFAHALNLVKTQKSANSPKAILVVSPHNPTGEVIKTGVQSPAIPIICDEVFAEFYFAAPRATPMATLCPATPVFMLNGISKMFALPDLKLGWVAMNAPAAEKYAEQLELINDTFLGANSLSQFMLPTLFERGLAFTAKMREGVNANLQLALKALSTCPHIHVSPPDGGYYLFAKVLGFDGDEDDLALFLLDHGVLVYPGYFYNCHKGHHIMISCLTERSRLELGLARLVQALIHHKNTTSSAHNAVDR